MTFIRRFLFVGLMLINFPGPAGTLEIIQLRHQSAEQIIPVIRPLLEHDSVVTGTGFKLIVKASPQQLSTIRELVKQLDMPVQQLIISVSHDQDIRRQLDRRSLSGRISNDHVTLSGGNTTGKGAFSATLENDNGRIRAGLDERQSRNRVSISQQVQTLSGRPALIRTGSSIPLPQQQVTVTGGRTIVSRSVQYQNVDTGFYVTPRVNGRRVTLQISAQKNRPGRGGYGPNVIDTQQVTTTIQGELGKWMELGNINETSSSRQSVILGEQQSSVKDSRHVFVKVDLASENTAPGFTRPSE